MANPEHFDILKLGVDVWNQWREENPGLGPDFSGADLTGFDLAHMDAGSHYDDLADFLYNEREYRETIPVGEDMVRFARSNLEDDEVLWDFWPSPADFSNACLENANLENANLEEADFKNANLKNANLTNAFLKQADLRNANLTYAKLTGSKMDLSKMADTILGANDLSGVFGLEIIHHYGPSIVDMRTLELSSGKIPLKFLLGIGISNQIIKNVTNEYNEVLEKNYLSCFISYSHKDKKFAKTLYKKLQDRGIRCWLDERELYPGDDLYDSVRRSINRVDRVLLCCSKNSLTSEWVNNEIDLTLEKEQRMIREQGEKAICLIPLDLDGYMSKHKWTNEREKDLNSRIIADFTDWENNLLQFHNSFETIVKALRSERQLF